MTKEEFVLGYAERSNVTPEWLADRKMIALACACGDETCKGWAMVRDDPESIEVHNQLYAPRPEEL